MHVVVPKPLHTFGRHALTDLSDQRKLLAAKENLCPAAKPAVSSNASKQKPRRIAPAGLDAFWIGVLRRPSVRDWSLIAALLLQRGAQNVAERSAGIGGAILGNRFLLLGDLQRLDGDLDFPGLLVESDDARVDLLTDGETLGALLVAVTGKVVPLDEGLDVMVDEPDF